MENASENDLAVRPDTGPYRVLVAGTDLKFRPLVLDDPKPTGRQVITAAGFKPADNHIVLQWLESGDLEELRLNEQTDLRGRGVERFIIDESDRSFRFEVEGERQEWPARFINGVTLKKLGKKDPNEVAVFLERQDAPDEEIDDDQIVDLAQKGVEKFYFRPVEVTVEIFVNNKPVKISRGKHTGLDIKRVAIAQHIAIQLDFVLSLEKGPGEAIIIGDNDVVQVKRGQHYIAVADDDKS